MIYYHTSIGYLSQTPVSYSIQVRAQARHHIRRSGNMTLDFTLWRQRVSDFNLDASLTFVLVSGGRSIEYT